MNKVSVRRDASARAAGLEAHQRVAEGVDVLDRVVRRERRTDRGFEAETPEDGLRAVMARADGDAFLIERAADVFRSLAVEDEREHARLLRRGADHREARDAQEALG